MLHCLFRALAKSRKGVAVETRERVREVTVDLGRREVTVDVGRRNVTVDVERR